MLHHHFPTFQKIEHSITIFVKRRKIVSVIILLLLAVLIYGIVSYKVFSITTFLSKPIDCMPSWVEPGFSLWGYLFGYYCVSW